MRWGNWLGVSEEEEMGRGAHFEHAACLNTGRAALFMRMSTKWICRSGDQGCHLHNDMIWRCESKWHRYFRARLMKGIGDSQQGRQRPLKKKARNSWKHTWWRGQTNIRKPVNQSLNLMAKSSPWILDRVGLLCLWSLPGLLRNHTHHHVEKLVLTFFQATEGRVTQTSSSSDYRWLQHFAACMLRWFPK